MSDVEVTDEDKAAAVVAFRRLLGFDPMPLLSKSDSAVMQTLQEFHAQARAAGKAEGRRELRHLHTFRGPRGHVVCYDCMREQDVEHVEAALITARNR